MAEQTVSQSSGGAETLKALVEAKIQSVLAKPKTEITTMPGWWNVWVYGLHLDPAPGHPLTPQKMVKVGDRFYVTTIVWFNPVGGATSPCNLITNLGQGIDIQYHTGNLNTWNLGPGPMNVVHNIPLVPNQCWYVDYLELTAQAGWEACYEMNICALIKGCAPGAKPPLAGFATAIRDIDSDTFYPPATPWGGGATPAPGVGARWEFDIPLRFMIYP